MKAVEITDNNYEELMKSNPYLVMDFFGTWCGPCKMLSPIIDDLAKDFDGKVLIGKVDVDANPVLSSKYGIRNIPAVLFIKNEEVVDKNVGAAPKSFFANKINTLLNE